MSSRRERRYPPSPYPARSEATRQYRDSWDLGWRHYATLRGSVLDFESGLTGPRQAGYRAGVLARWSYEQRAKQIDPDVLRERREEMLRERRQAGMEERPY